MIVQNQNDIDNLKKIGSIVANCLQHMLKSIEVGMTTNELDELGSKFLESHGARSAPILMYNFPGHTCISVNHVAAHGTPSHYVIRQNDLINIDVSAELNGYFADTGASLVVAPNGKRAKEFQKMARSGRRALSEAIRTVKSGSKLNLIGKAVSDVASKAGYFVIPDLCSHGVGRALHEDPREISSIYNPNDKRTFADGQVFTIEPFLADHCSGIELWKDDGWSLVNNSQGFSVQYEHTMIATKRGAMVLTHPDSDSEYFF